MANTAEVGRAFWRERAASGNLGDRRYLWPKEKRKFGGETYTFLTVANNKREAEAAAERWRKMGLRKIRISPFGKGYTLYYKKA